MIGKYTHTRVLKETINTAIEDLEFRIYELRRAGELELEGG